MIIQLSASPCASTSAVLIHDVDVTDGDLLARWIAVSDSAALDTLVRRHGAMVLGVCRRILGNTTDAEDAFQMTFLILVRKARTLSSPSQVAGWLHGVAFQVSRRMKVDLARLRQREAAIAADHPAPLPPEDTTDAQRILDEELDRLPDKYRLPIVLCELEGLTLDEAARRLGWPKGTVAGRLSRGRDILRRRLSRQRRVVIPMIMLGAPGFPGLENTPCDLPNELISATVAGVRSPDGSTAQTAATIVDAIARDLISRRWLKYTIAILIAIFLSATGFQAQAVLGQLAVLTGQGKVSGSCH
jgi:RNA polymerase sigma factor (sigma-70 family)